mgnify:CR=1 FL=1
MRRFIALVLALALGLWLALNPIGKFGLHAFGFTVYSGIPVPYFDITVHADGRLSLRRKSHYVPLSEVEALLKEKPDVIIVGIGYNQMVQVDEQVKKLPVEVKILETSKAIEEFNRLKSQGKRVAAIIHTTC